MQSPVTKPKPKAKVNRLALCIGLGHYDNFKTLSAPPKDALAVASRLVDPRVGQFERVHLLTDEFDCQLTPDNPTPPPMLPISAPAADPQISDTDNKTPVTSKAINRALTAVFENYDFDEDSLLVIFFAGHGAPSNNKELYLFGSDGERTEGGAVDFASGFHLNARLGHFLSATKTTTPGKIIILLDACYAGSADNIWEHILFKNSEGKEDLKQIYLLGAAQDDQEAGSSKQHGYFTQCLLEAFVELPPTPTTTKDWITMLDIQQYVSSNLKRVSKGKAQHIQGVNLFRTPIPLVKNLLFSHESAEFKAKIQEILELDEHLKITPPPTHSELPPALILAEIEGRWGQTDLEAYYCLDNSKSELSGHDVTGVTLRLKILPDVNKYIIVTRLSVKPSLQREASLVLPNLVFLTEDTLLGRTLNFSKYDERLLGRYERGEKREVLWDVPPLGKVYVGLRGEERRYNLKTEAENRVGEALDSLESSRTIRLELKYELSEPLDLQEHVLNWLDDKLEAHRADKAAPDSRMVITGTYGTGKSSFCTHIAAELIRKKHRRKPIIIELGKYAGSVSIDFDDFIEIQLAKNGVTNLSRRKLQKWAQAGRLFFIFDGFDEMASRSDDRVKSQHLKWINEWASMPNNKVLVTTRPEYFLTRADERDLLRQYRQVFCYLLNRAQREEYLQKRVAWYNHHELRSGKKAYGWKIYRDKIRQIYDLSNLQQRFVLLEMIVKTLPDYIQQDVKEVTRVKLYKDYLTKELTERQEDKNLFSLKQISAERRLELVEELAYRLYMDRARQSERKFDHDEARSWLEPVLTPSENRVLDKDWTALLTNLFLVPAGEFQFEFSHKSFLEYLVAVRLDRQLQQNPHDFSGLAQRRLTPIIADFLAELNEPPAALIDAADALEPEASDTFVYSVGQLVLSRRLYRLSRPIILDKASKEVDSKLITCLEYQVFIFDEIERNRRYYYPDHWNAPRFVPGKARHELTGLTDFDAEAFCEWLNERGTSEIDKETTTGPGHRQAKDETVKAFGFRLPTVHELAKQIAVNLPYSIWYSRNDEIHLSQSNPVEHKKISAALANLEQLSGLPPASYNASAREKTSALASELASARSIVRNFHLNMDFIRPSDHDYDLYRASARALRLDHALEEASALVLKLDRNRERSRNNYFASTNTNIHRPSVKFDRDLGFDLAIGTARDFDHASTSSLAVEFARVFERVYPLTKAVEFDEVTSALEERHYEQVFSHIERLRARESDELTLRRITFLCLIIQMLIAGEAFAIEEYREAQRKYTREYLYYSKSASPPPILNNS
jgi:hypothetical protein